MAKKRRLSKRDRRTKNWIKIKRKWEILLEDKEFRDRIFPLIDEIDPERTGGILIKMGAFMYCIFDDEEKMYTYGLAVLAKEGVLVFTKPVLCNWNPL